MLNEFSALAYYNMLRCPHPKKKAKAYYHITSPAYIASGSVASSSILCRGDGRQCIYRWGKRSRVKNLRQLEEFKVNPVGDNEGTLPGGEKLPLASLPPCMIMILSVLARLQQDVNYEKVHSGKTFTLGWMTVMHRQSVQSGPFPTRATVHEGILLLLLHEATVVKWGDFTACGWRWVRNRDAESCRALAVQFEISFHFHGKGTGSKKMCPLLLSIIQANTAEQIHNSTTQEHMQFIVASVFLLFFFFF